MESETPKRPVQLPEYSEECLSALVQKGLAPKISLGGALGLSHYLDYRPTHDVDAWWAEEVSSEEQQQVVATIESVLQRYGTVSVRRWGDVVSIELRPQSRKVFSFQIARRSAHLEPPGIAPWIAVPLDTLPDLIAAKMTALVERGAPRDFRDIYTLCQSGKSSPEECWSLWRRREKLAGSDPDSARARLAISTHLARIMQHRRLEDITHHEERSQAARLRTWFLQVFLEQAQ